MELQESKKNLAGVLLSAHDGGQADDSLGALQVCKVMSALTIMCIDNGAEIEIVTVNQISTRLVVRHVDIVTCRHTKVVQRVGSGFDHKSLHILQCIS